MRLPGEAAAGNERIVLTVMFRRGACPGLLNPMETGDGLLARLPPVRMPLAAFAGLCAAARAHGNGVVEVTARGSIQIRGLKPASVIPFADSVAALGIEVPDGPVVIANPLAGLDAAEAADLTGLVAELRRRIAAASFAAGAGAESFGDRRWRRSTPPRRASARTSACAPSRAESLLLTLGDDVTTATQLGRVRREDRAGGGTRAARSDRAAGTCRAGARSWCGRSGGGASLLG